MRPRISLLKYYVLFFLTVFLFFFNSPVQAQQPADTAFTVSGTVSDESGRSLEGATIEVKGMGTRTATKADGKFSIPASRNSTLLITSVGYLLQQVPVKGQSNVTVALKSNIGNMDEVVVVGYGTAKRREITGAVASFSTKGIEEKPVTRIDQAMIGQMAGVQVKQQTSMPGQGLSIAVRGTGSISGGTEPLYVIDGFPLDVVSQNSAGGFSGNPLNNLNPNDIESIQVLKDAAAGAIYGSRAANGVVLITTKRGQIGKARINVNANSGFSQVGRKLDVLSGDEWVALSTELANSKWVASAPGRTASQTPAQRRAILGTNNVNLIPDERWAQPGHPGLRFVDWQDEAFRTAPFQNYEVSASGGTEAVRYFVSGGYLNQAGVLLSSGYKNYSARANVEVNANKRLKLGFNLAPTYSETNAPLAEGKDNQLMKLFNMTPVVEDTAGLNTGAGKNATYAWANSNISPVASLLNTISLTKTTRILYSMYGELQVANGLSVKSTINYDEGNQNYKRYISDFVGGNRVNYLTAPGKSASGTYNGFKKQNFVTENTINYTRTFKDVHSINAVAGMSYNFVHVENYTLSTAGGFANNSVTTLNNAIPNASGVTVTGNSTESNNTLLSYYGRLQYSYSGKYLLTASIRRDASSRFGVDSRWGTFPSVSAGWRISDENFMKGITFINDLKLRVSYGKSGSSNIGDYAAIPSITSANYSFGGNTPISLTGQVPSAVANPLLHWETSNTYDAGFDASFLNNRLSVIFDAYLRRSSDLFLRIPILAASGFTSSLQNIGTVDNKGLELSVNSVNVKGRNFQWTTSANIAFNHNEVTSLGGSQLINVPTGYGGNPPFLLQLGLPMYSYYLIRRDGILTADDIANPKVTKLPGQTVGDAKFYDRDGNGRIDANDRVIAGQPNPKYTWGLTNTFRYKDVDLSIQMYGQQGGYIYSFLARAMDNPANGRATNLGVWRDRWTATNQNANAPRGKIDIGYTTPFFTTDWLYSSDFWRVQNITLGYNLKSIIKAKILNGARIYASAQNLFGHDKFKGGVNPEAQNTNVSGSGDFPLPGDYGAMPLSKTFTFGVNLSF